MVLFRDIEFGTSLGYTRHSLTPKLVFLKVGSTLHHSEHPLLLGLLDCLWLASTSDLHPLI